MSLALIALITFVNPAFTALTGYEAHEAVGRNCRFLQGANSDRWVVSEIRAALSAGHPIRREILNYRKNGDPFWNDLTIDPIHDDAGALIGFVGMQYDVSELPTRPKTGRLRRNCASRTSSATSRAMSIAAS